MGTEAYYNHAIFKGLRLSSDLQPPFYPTTLTWAPGTWRFFTIRSTVFIRYRGNP